MSLTDIKSSDAVVMTLDAGGTNFVFSAMQRGEEVLDSFSLPSFGSDLNRSLNQLLKGFRQVKYMLPVEPVAISFAFPGPADYPQGIIGDLVNLPGYRGGVPLGPILENEFKIPVFINNDGDLFAYGEAMAGFLPRLNQTLSDIGSIKRYRNLLGVTLGTGFGGGLVHEGRLLLGDNAAAAEVWAIQHPERPDVYSEEGLSIRGVKRLYLEFSGEEVSPDPKDISMVARGEMAGNQEAAINTFKAFGKILGASLANALTLVDAPVVVGGGIARAYDLFIDSALERLNSQIRSLDGKYQDRLEFKVFDFENKQTRDKHLLGQPRDLSFPGLDKPVTYDPVKRIPIGRSVLGTSRAIALGAYAIAVNGIET